MTNDQSNNAFGNVHEFSVSELSTALKRTVEEQFGYVRLRGEISGFKRHSSGHCYFALKDEKSVIDAVIWRGNASKVSFRPEDGLEVIATGRVTTYPARSKYQMVIDHMEPAGVGALMALLEERKKQLMAEGLFAPERKKRIPFLPKVIGVVTSPTGAVIRDILHRLQDRCPRRVLLWPVSVQGEGAAEAIAAAIESFNALPDDGAVPKPDVLIVARGGGSLEDLWAFNEEVVVRAAADSRIPLISAVGHETDTTLIDYASDKRAPTPTAAAEMAVPVMADLRYTVGDFAVRLDRVMARNLDRGGERVIALSRALPKLRDIVSIPEQRLDELRERLPRALNVLVGEKRSLYHQVEGRLQSRLLSSAIGQYGKEVQSLGKQSDQAIDTLLRSAGGYLNAQDRLLNSLSYERVLERGFALISDEKDQPITKARDARAGQAIRITFSDAGVDAIVASKNGSSKPKKPPIKKNAQKDVKMPEKSPKQGQLFE